MYIDAENLFFEDKAVAASLTSDVIDLGNPGPFTHPLYIVVKLTTKMTSGSMDSFKVQSSATEEFNTAQDIVEATVPTSIDQTAAPAQLAVLYAPIKPGNRYIRLVGTGSSPAGGKITAYMTSGVKVDL